MSRHDTALLMREIESRGLELATDGADILVRPVDAIPPDLLERIRSAKSEVLALLREGESSSIDVEVCRHEPPGRFTVCYCCGGASFWAVARIGNWICATCHQPDGSPDDLVWTRVRSASSPYGLGEPDPNCSRCNGSGVTGSPSRGWKICVCRERSLSDLPSDGGTR